MIHKILVTGGSGFIGSEICNQLIAKGYEVAILTRNKKTISINQYVWDIDNGIIDPAAIKFADAIIHLAGENISSKRWTEKQKKKILESRLKSTKLIYKYVKNASVKPKLIISASAIGYYGNKTTEKIYSEESPNGTDFLAKTVFNWEESMSLFTELKIRTIILRLGVVFSIKGGALKKILLPVKFGFVNPIGSGNQYIPWVSLNDIANLFLFLIANKNIKGVYNAVHPEQINNKELMQKIAIIKNKPFIPIGVPPFLLKLVYGEMANTILHGSHVSSSKITNTGFIFNDQISDLF